VKTVSAARIAAQFNEYLKASRKEPVLITQNGKPVAVLLAIQDKDEAKQLAGGMSRSLRSIFEEAHNQLEQAGGIPEDQFWREVEERRRAKQPPSGRSKRVKPIQPIARRG
jgi:prevent-host-death family protein